MSRGTYDGQPVQEGHGGRLVYDCQPETADGCLIPVPADFLGIPVMPGSDGLEGLDPATLDQPAAGLDELAAMDHEPDAVLEAG